MEPVLVNMCVAPQPSPARWSAAAIASRVIGKRVAEGMVTGRFTRPQEVADLVLLASDRAGNVTGTDFVIDDGLVTTL